MRFSLFSALIVTLSSGFFVQASPLAAQVVWTPKILSPNTTTIWVAGEKEMVIWDTADTPPDVSNAGLVQIFKGPALTSEFNLVAQKGSIQVTVPLDLMADVYQIVLFGDSGNISPPFHICTKTGYGDHLDCANW
ncbi:hypothetical protein APHAL10511_000866 [Amanita phalloides]|nr:hypothetical protein APHAL10511_000866 [Amanita phalloides]